MSDFSLYRLSFARVIAFLGDAFIIRCLFKDFRALFSSADGLGLSFFSFGSLGMLK